MEKGIESLKEFSFALLDSADVGSDIWEDKKISFDDAFHLSRFMQILPAIAKSVVNVPAEGLDLTNEEEQELRVAINEKLNTLISDTESDKFEEIAKQAIVSALAFAKVASGFLQAKNAKDVG